MTQDYLKEIFYYRDGCLFWKNPIGRGKTNEKAGCFCRGLTTIGLLGRRWLAHRLIFLYHHGFMPDFIDHIDQNKSNNLIENLRPTTKSQNASNRGKTKSNTSGFKGVWFKKSGSKWGATIQKNRKSMHLGVFETPELAHEAYKKAAAFYHKEFAST